MTVTALFTTTKTALTIATTQDVLLERKGADGLSPMLTSGINPNVTLESGVFRIISSSGVRVTADTPNLHIVTFDKQGEPIEFGKLETNLETILPPGFS